MIYELTPPSNSINASVIIPGSKSYTNRALIIAAITEGITTLQGVSLSDDSIALLHALKKLGVSIIEKDNNLIEVNGSFQNIKPQKVTIDVGHAGTTYRFLTALLSCIPDIEVELVGSSRMHERPIGELVTALQKLGASIEYIDKKEFPPLLIKGKKLNGGTVQLSGNISSQFFSALMMVAPMLNNELYIDLVGQQVSKSYIDMTISTMHDFGLKVQNNNYNSYKIDNKNYTPGSYTIEGDASGASYFWGIAAISGGMITTKNIRQDSCQGDMKFLSLIEGMGCKVEYKNNEVIVTGTDKLKAIDADMENCPDTAQTLAVVASCAHGTTTLRGLQTLRIKETDRLQALETELAKIGITAVTTSDSIIINGRANDNSFPHPSIIETYQDHRMAMSFAMLGAKYNGIKINNPEVVSKSYPNYWQEINSIGIDIQ